MVAPLAALCVLPIVSQAMTVRREFAEIINVDKLATTCARSPTVESEIVAQVNRGDRVILLCWNEDETWCFVDYNGRMGWIGLGSSSSPKDSKGTSKCLALRGLK